MIWFITRPNKLVFMDGNVYFKHLEWGLSWKQSTCYVVVIWGCFRFLDLEYSLDLKAETEADEHWPTKGN